MKITKAKLNKIIKEEVLKEIRAFATSDVPGSEFTVVTKRQAPKREAGPLDDSWYLQFSNTDKNIEKCLGPYGDTVAGRFKCPSFVEKRSAPGGEQEHYYDASGVFGDDIYDRHDAYLKHKERGTKSKSARKKEAERLAKSIMLQKKILTLDPVKVMKSKVDVCKKMRGKCSGKKLGFFSKIFGASEDERRDAFWCDYCREKFCGGYKCSDFIQYLKKLENKIKLDDEKKSFMKARAEFEKEREAADLGKIPEKDK